jgi:hypothetical protein
MVLAVRHSRWQLSAVVALSGGLAYLCVLGVDASDNWFSRIFSAVLIPLFAYPGLLAVRRFFDTADILRIDATGLYDKRVVDRVVPWHAVAFVRETKIGYQRFFFVMLDEPVEHFVDSPFRRWWLRWFSWRGKFSISAAQLRVATWQIRGALAVYLNDRFATDQPIAPFPRSIG